MKVKLSSIIKIYEEIVFKNFGIFWEKNGDIESFRKIGSFLETKIGTFLIHQKF